MICPHCKRKLEFLVIATRAKSERAEYFRKRYLQSGRSKVRTSADQDGKCIDCGAPTIGQRWYCDDCRKLHRVETFLISHKKQIRAKKRKLELAKPSTNEGVESN